MFATFSSNFDMLKRGSNNWVYCCQVEVLPLKDKVELASDGIVSIRK